MKSQDIGLLQTIVNAVTALANDGDSVNVKVLQVNIRMLDNSILVFTEDVDTPGNDWHIFSGGPTSLQQFGG